MPSAELYAALLGPLGSLALSILALAWLSRECARARAGLEREHRSRLEDAQAASRAMLELQREILAAIERLEHVADLLRDR